MDTGWVRCTASRMETVFWWAGARFSVARRMMVRTTRLGCLALGGLVRLSHPTQRPVGWDKRTIRHIVGQTRNALPTLWLPKAQVAPAHQNTGPIPNAVHPMDTGWVRCTDSRMETVFWWAGARFSVARRRMVRTTRLGCLALGGLVRLSHPTQRPVGWDKRTIRHIVGQTRNALPTLWLPKAQVAPAHQNTGPIPNTVHPMDTGWVRCTASRMETVFWWAGARFSVARRMMVKTTRLGCLALGGLVRLSHPTQRPVGWDKRTIRHIVGQTRNALPTLLAAQSTGSAGPPEYGSHPECRASNGYGLDQMHRLSDGNRVLVGRALGFPLLDG